MNNPYAWNIVNPNLCYGRDTLVNELCVHLAGTSGHSRLSFGVIGGRRMGKTTLLRRVEQRLHTSVPQWRRNGWIVIPIYIDGLVLPRPLTAKQVWEHLFHELQTTLPKGLLTLSSVPDFSTFREIIEPIFVGFPDKLRVIVLFDEIERIMECDWSLSFFGNLRALLSNSKMMENFAFVFSGAHEMAKLQHDTTSPISNILTWRHLYALDYTSACQLMQGPIAHTWSEGFLKRVYQESGGQPMLLQYIMQQVCMISLDVADQLLDQAVRQFGLDQRGQFYVWWTKYLTPVAQQLYARLPEDGTVLPKRTLIAEFGKNETNDALEILQHMGLIAIERDGFDCRYSGEMFRRWYRDNVIVSDELEEFIAKGENAQLEFKVAACFNPFRKVRDETLKDNIVQSVAAFMNSSNGGLLLIGVSDTGEAEGLDEDYKAVNPQKPSRDSYELFLRNLLSSKLGINSTHLYTIDFHQVAGRDICRISVKASIKPIFLDGELYIRDGNRKRKLKSQETFVYVQQRWGKDSLM